VRTDPETITEPVDVVLLAFKDTQTPAAAAWLARLCDESTTVLALQNGVEQVERVGRYCQGSTVLPAVVWFSVETQPQGWVRLRTPVALVLPATPAADRLAETLRGPRLSIETDPDFVTAAWHKLLTNAVGGLMALSGRKSGCSAATTWPTWPSAEGAKLEDAVIEDVVGLFSGLPEDITTSILTDRELSWPLEWDIRNGVIVRKAAEHGLATPISAVLVPLLAAASDGPG
jgi:2-dehydropantoate 2-reductase